jgi:hypothetical protein
MRVLVGSFRNDIGTVELPAADGSEGLVYAGPDPEHMRSIVESEREWYDRAGIEHTVPLVAAPHRMPSLT